MTFESDQYPGRPRILFIGLAENSHTYSWIDLLDGAAFNVRLFAMPTGVPPSDWKTRTYITAYSLERTDLLSRKSLYPPRQSRLLAKRAFARLIFGNDSAETLRQRWLARIIRQWKPDIIHTLGIEQGGEFYLHVRRKFGLERIGKWVLQTRGGSDLALTHLNPKRRKELVDILGSCDQLISDNEQNFRIARELGVREEQLAPIAPVPGTGGIDVESLHHRWQGPTSSRRVIVWPKAYDSPWAKMLPIYEALKMVWERIQPCEIHMLSMLGEANMWFWSLPEAVRQSCVPRERVSRAEVLEIMTKARVMLAPALIDGVPNSLYEAMACGALPIVSPLETIVPIVKNEENVLFARNLYPDEIAAALARAMTEDALVDAVAERNLELVRRIANRNLIRPRVIEFYEKLSRGLDG
ncbi:MAG TPA: glycosyltransferase family 4 protein [Pyrinomonadaceae bacterium]|nr:glycosyltransferase family 4 protein [Pyrinomonadaceae bacterium]